MDLGLMPAAGGGACEAKEPLVVAETKPNFKNSGNRCGHKPAEPKWDLFILKGKFRPRQVESLQKGFVDYYSNPWLLPTLATLSERKKNNGDAWQNRSEGREADVLVGNTILSFTEYASLRIGTPKKDGDFVNRSCREIAAHCGLSAIRTAAETAAGILPSPSQRFWRSFRRLRAAGMFTVHRVYEVVGHDDDGKSIMRGRPAIKCLDQDFLLCLGRLDLSRLIKFRERCSKTLKAERDLYAREIHNTDDAKQARNRTKFKVDVGGFDTPKKKAPPKEHFKHQGLTELEKEYRNKKSVIVSELVQKRITDTDIIRRMVELRIGTEAAYCTKHQNRK